MSKNRILNDSIALASVKVFTMATSILATMVMSKNMPLTEYGTYSTGNLIINTATLLSAFGLIDAVNFYYNGKKVKDREAYVNTVFSLILICGAVAAVVVLGAQGLITMYFHNPQLGAIYAYIAFRPLLHNFSFGLQNLQVSIGKAKIVAIRNAIISTTKLLAIMLTALYTKNITTIFICMLIIESVALFFYYAVLKNNNVHVYPFKPDWTKAKEILIFCIPMGIYLQTNSLSRDLDKFVIGYFENTDNLAIYTNCSAKLPFDLVSGPLLTLLIPLLTRCIKNDEYKSGADLYRCYLKIGYIFTFAFGFGCITVASQVVDFLYGSQYISGVPVFIVYVVVDMINFINYSLVLTSKGKTKDLMKVSCGALLANIVINLLLYKLMGFIGPAVATVIITLGVSTILLVKSARILQEKVFKLFDIKHLLIYFAELLVLGVALHFVRVFLESINLHYFIILVIVGGIFVITMLLLNIKEIKKCFVILNQINKTNIE